MNLLKSLTVMVLKLIYSKPYVKIVNSVDTAVFQAALNALCLWADKWQLTVAVDKCCVLHIGKADKIPTVYLIKNVALPAVLSCRDLRITITHDLSPSTHITDIVAKAHRLCYNSLFYVA